MPFLQFINDERIYIIPNASFVCTTMEPDRNVINSWLEEINKTSTNLYWNSLLKYEKWLDWESRLLEYTHCYLEHASGTVRTFFLLSFPLFPYSSDAKIT